MIYNMIGGGANQLNFKVVGSATEPSNPAENTIWVQTSVAITSWKMRYATTTPTSAAPAGYLIISLESAAAVTSSTSTLNALKKNEMMIKLGAAYICIDGTASGWASVNAYIYKSGAWVQFSSVFAATIAVTYPSGSTLTCTDGTTTLKATTTTGSYTFVVPNAGTWTVTATDGSSTASSSVSITTSGQSESVTLSYWDGYLFNYGDTYDDITGGYNNVGTYLTSASDGSTGNPLTITELNSGGWKLKNSKGNGCGIVYTKNKIDLTDFTTLHFHGRLFDALGYSRTGLGIWSSVADAMTTNRVAYLGGNAAAVGERTLDVTSLNGEYYIGVWVYSSDSNYQIKEMNKIWLT